MKNKWSYGYVIRDKEGIVRLQAEGYKSREEVEQAANEALLILPEDYSLEIRYDSPVYKLKHPFDSLDAMFQKEEEEIPPNAIIH